MKKKPEDVALNLEDDMSDSGGKQYRRGKRNAFNYDKYEDERTMPDKYKHLRIGYLREDDEELILPDEQAEEDEQKGHLLELSYLKTKKHQYDSHPRDREDGVPWNWWRAKIRYIPMPCCNFIKDSKWVTEPAKEIGLGATLFLMTNKAMFWLFVFFAIVNIPLMAFYFNGNGPSYVVPGFVGFLGRLTLGNVGTSDYTCNQVNIASYKKTMFLSCNYGTMHQLYQFGLQKIDN